MSSENWGDLQKSQVDPHTIDEEIDDKIQAHDDDPDAHLDPTQSLQSHKASEIIDHLAESIIEDKIATGEISSRCITTDQVIGKDFRTAEDVGVGVDGVKFDDTGIEMWQDGDKKVDIPVSGDPTFKGNVKIGSLEYLKFTLQTSFESIDGWEKTDGVTVSFGHIELASGVVLDHETYLYCVGDSTNDSYPLNAKNPIFDVVLNIYSTTATEFYFGIGYPAEENGCGFLIYSGDLYAYCMSEFGVEHKYSLTTPDLTYTHRYRVEIENDVETRWYVDGVLVLTKTWAQTDGISDSNIAMMFNLVYKAGSQQIVVVYNCMYQQDF